MVGLAKLLPNPEALKPLTVIYGDRLCVTATAVESLENRIIPWDEKLANREELVNLEPNPEADQA